MSGNASNETDLLIPARPKILVVDDESAARTLLYIGLRRAEFLVSQAASGAAAVEIYRQQQKDIVAVILDVSMPGQDGPETLAALQTINPHVLFCFLNDAGSGYPREDLLALGARFVFEKPLRLASIAPMVRQMVDSARHRPAAPPSAGREPEPAKAEPRVTAPQPLKRVDSPAAPQTERRAAVRYPCTMESSCQPIARVHTADSWPARVRDISATGIRFALGRRFEPGTLLVFELETPRLSRLLLAHVIHVKAAADGNWLVGCILTHALSEDDVRDLANQTGELLRADDVMGVTEPVASGSE
ncbi:MAG TPA: response regulator [Gemmataceae bacterium]|nr:response regulator [Gemmataceae bacterium]